MSNRAKSFSLISGIAVILLLVGCAPKLQTVTGTLGFVVNPFMEKCSDGIGITGTLKSGTGEILGTIRMESILSEKPAPADVNNQLKLCTAKLIANEIDLSGNVLTVDFSGGQRWSGKWILQKSDFSNGVLNLRAY